MNKGLLILAVGALAGLLAFFLSRGKPAGSGDPVLLDSLPEIAWLRTDLKLDDEQFAKVRELHHDYRPVCAEMCRRIAESEAAVAKLAQSRGGMTDDLSQAIEHHGHVIAACKRSMLEHLYQTAGLMNGDQAKRYLEITLPLALDSARGRSTTACHD